MKRTRSSLAQALLGLFAPFARQRVALVLGVALFALVAIALVTAITVGPHLAHAAQFAQSLAHQGVAGVIRPATECPGSYGSGC